MELTNSFIIDRLRVYTNSYKTAKPFPHIIIDKLWNNLLLEKIESEFNSFNCWDGEKEFFGSINKRFSNNIQHFKPHTKSLIEFCNSSYFINFLEDLTGISKLFPDPELLGGGMHSTGRDGFLKMHVDFNWSDHIQMYRRINLLIYLNKSWDPSWRGQLIFGSKYSKKDVGPKIKFLEINHQLIYCYL